MKSSEAPVVEENPSKYGEQLNYDPEFHGPVKSRSCTDILCLFLFVSFLAGWGVVAIFAFREGDPKVLVYPTDSAGNICGIGDLEDKPYLFFFDLMKCASPKVVFSGCPTPQMCVEKCPNETFHAESLTDSAEMKSKLICKYDVKKESKSVKDLVEGGHCATLYLKSSPLLGRCIPELFYKGSNSTYVHDDKNRPLTDGNSGKLTVEAVQNATGHLAQFLSIGEMGAKVFSDFRTSWKFLIAGLVLSMLISLVWIVLMRWIATPMVWISILLVLGALVYGCYYSTTRYIDLKDVEGSDREFRVTLNLKSYLALRKTWLAFAISCGLLFAILFLIIVFLRKRIRIAIALIKQASRAVATMPTSLFFPILPYLMMVIFLALWITIAVYIASSGKASFVFVDAPAGSKTIKNGTTCNPKRYNATGDGVKCLFQSYGLKDSLFSSQAYNLFGLFWGLFFSVGVGQVALAGAFASYYWTRDKTRDIPTLAVASALCRAMRYHLGSVAFGSLLIATVRFIRVILEYIDKKLKKYDNPVTRAIICCCKCCFWILETILKYISKNAYIMIAIYGSNFCVSAKRAFFLLMRNLVRVVVVDKVTDFLLLMGKLVVVACTAGISFYLFATEQTLYKGIPQLNYNLMPPIVISVGAYLIASAFFSVYGMAVDTLFLCFLEDCERNDGSSERPYFMSKELMKILHKKNKFRDLSPQH